MAAQAAETPRRQFREGRRRRGAPRHVEQGTAGSGGGLRLSDDEPRKIDRMEAIAHLESPPAKADVAERPAACPGMNPPRKNPLVSPAKLPRAGQDAAAVHDHGYSRQLGVFKRQRLGCEFRRTIERDGRRRGKVFTDALRPDSGREFRRCVDLVGAASLAQWHRGQGGDRVDAARAQDHDARAAPGGCLEQIHGAQQVVLEQLP